MRNHCLYCKCNCFYSDVLFENNYSKAKKDPGEQAYRIMNNEGCTASKRWKVYKGISQREY